MKQVSKRQPKPWWWLSFSSESNASRGVVLVRARDLVDAVRICHALSLSPGGQILGVPMPFDFAPPEKFKNRLLTRSEVLELDPDVQSLGEWEDEERRNPQI